MASLPQRRVTSGRGVAPGDLSGEAAEIGSALQRSPDSVLVDAIDALQSEPRVVLGLRRADDLRAAAATSPDGAWAARRLAVLVHSGDDLTALGAIHALGAVNDPYADEVLVGVVADGDEPFTAHAAWSLAARRPQLDAVAALVRLCLQGGFPAMLAERTLLEWVRQDVAVLGAVAKCATEAWQWPTRGRVVAVYDTLVAALEASPPAAPGDGAFAGDSLDDYGIVVIQPCVHARIDADGSSLGVGDSGGVASLLRSLGPALADQPAVGEVISVVRGEHGLTGPERIAPGHSVYRLAIGPDGPLPSREAWQYRVEVERQLLHLGRSLAHRRVVWHLRMADVGTLAAAAAARKLGQPVVFTAAPDPHVVMEAAQDAGRLSRRDFAVEDAAHHYWFRARLVERVARQAEHLVLLPRPTIERELQHLAGVDVVDHQSMQRRATAVPEGIDLSAADRARLAYRTAGPSAPVAEVLATLPVSRRSLPWLITVGRLHPSKGAQRLVEAVVGDRRLVEHMNVIVVGGDLTAPTADEQSTIERIRTAAQHAPSGAVTLVGSRPPAVVAAMLAHVSATGGVYVCASDKEEFGLAIVEALAAGTVVVAPQRGGPQTYIEQGGTGIVCDTASVPALVDAIVEARALVGGNGRQQRARDRVRSELSIDAMASSLAAIYRRVVAVTPA